MLESVELLDNKVEEELSILESVELEGKTEEEGMELEAIELGTISVG